MPGAVIRLLLVAVLALSACACGRAATPASPRPPVAAEVPLRFSVPLAGGLLRARLGVPIIEADVEGVPTLLIVDTGSSHHVLTTALAGEAGAVHGALLDDGVDHTGGRVAVARAADVRLSAGTLRGSLRDVRAVEPPSELDLLGIGGFVSPQRLVDRGWVVLDFPRARLVWLDGSSESMEAWLRVRAGGARAVEVPRLAGRGAHGTHGLYVRTALEGRADVVAELDTGSRQTDFAASYVGAATREETDLGLAVGGARTRGALVPGMNVAFAERVIGPLAVRARREIPPAGVGKRAVLGMDVLGRFVVAIPADPRLPLRVVETPRSLDAGPGGGRP